MHGVSNLAEALRAKVIAYDPRAALYVVKDAEGKIWGVKSEKLRPLHVLGLSSEWSDVPEGAMLPVSKCSLLCMCRATVAFQLDVTCVWRAGWRRGADESRDGAAAGPARA